jgi:hypothetical protein
MKTLDSFDFAALPQLSKTKVLALAERGFIRDRENIICLAARRQEKRTSPRPWV